MRQPSLRLTDRGNGRETVRIAPTNDIADAEGTPSPVIGEFGPPIPAIVTRQDGKVLEANGTDESSYAYTVMALSGTDPGVAVKTVFMVDNAVVSRTMVAVTGAVLRAPRTWTWGANEVAAV